MADPLGFVMCLFDLLSGAKVICFVWVLTRLRAHALADRATSRLAMLGFIVYSILDRSGYPWLHEPTNVQLLGEPSTPPFEDAPQIRSIEIPQTTAPTPPPLTTM